VNTRRWRLAMAHSYCSYCTFLRSEGVYQTGEGSSEPRERLSSKLTWADNSRGTAKSIIERFISGWATDALHPKLEGLAASA
jgi:hypothetical protein